MAIDTKSAIFQLLSANGDGTGITSQAVNGSVTSVEFSVEPPSGKSYVLRRMNIEAIDGNFNNALQYGTIAGLTNGIKIHIEDEDGETIKDFTAGVTIKRSFDWTLLAGVDNIVAGAAGADALTVRWTFTKGYDDLILNGDKGEKLVVTIQDDLTGLDDQLMMVQGFEMDNKTESKLKDA